MPYLQDTYSKRTFNLTKLFKEQKQDRILFGDNHLITPIVLHLRTYQEYIKDVWNEKQKLSLCFDEEDQTFHMAPSKDYRISLNREVSLDRIIPMFQLHQGDTFYFCRGRHINYGPLTFKDFKRVQ